MAERHDQFRALQNNFARHTDPTHEHMARVMKSFEPGLFVGVDGDGPQDNLDLERWFRKPKGHERRIHGHRHAGVRIVQEGATLVLVLDAHANRQGAFTPEELLPYRRAVSPNNQRQAIQRRKVMRKARSKKKRSVLLAELERRYREKS